MQIIQTLEIIQIQIQQELDKKTNTHKKISMTWQETYGNGIWKHIIQDIPIGE